MVCNACVDRGGRHGREPENTNTEFELRGFNHLALVCRDMAETVAWYEDMLGMKLVKTLELPGGRGQHFFLDMGNGVDGIAFFWFPDAPEGVPRRVDPGPHGISAIGSMNHVAFDVPAGEVRRVPAKLLEQGRRGHDDHQPRRTPSTAATSPTTTPPPTTATCSSARCTSRDPNGTMLEFACWTKALDESDVTHVPASATNI